MRFAVLDSMNAGLSSMLFHISCNGLLEREFPLGYSAEVRFQPHTRELVVLESDAYVRPMKFYLRLLDSERMTEIARREIPVRPMYAGFPGRSIAGSISRSGRYVYFLRSGPVIRHPDNDLSFRLTPIRWDRQLDAMEVGLFCVESCNVDYGIVGNSEDSLFLHLSCECSSTVAFGSFGSPDCNLIQMEKIPRRQHGPLETNGSWHDTVRGFLYCVNREGVIYEVRLSEQTSRVLARLRLGPKQGVPVHQIYGAAGEISVGVAGDDGYMGLGMVTEIWSVSADTGEFLERRVLPQPAMNFVVTPDGAQLVALDPFSRNVFCVHRETGEEIWNLRDFGNTPGEIIITC